MIIDSFEGQYRWLSNFWPAVVMLDGYSYPSVEHAYQAAKSLDVDYRWRCRSALHAGLAKRLGRTAALRHDWDTSKVGIMRELVRQKFAHPELAEKLLATGDAELIEGNHWNDTFWGVCRGRGLNMLGQILMETRFNLKQGT